MTQENGAARPGRSLGDRFRQVLPARLGGAPRSRRTRKSRGSRGSAELSVVVVAASLVAGLAFGEGLSRTVVDITDGLTWVSDDPSGEVIQINPATGQPEKRLTVGAPGEDIEVTQADGRLFVTNRTTGEVFSLDLASVLVSGQRRVSAGDSTQILLHDDNAFLVDRSTSSISRIDTSTTDAIGERWLAPEGLADATIDGEGFVWAIDKDGRLEKLRWSDDERRFITEQTETVDYSGDNSVLVGHPAGVTVFGPDAGIVVQVGTGSDVVANAPGLQGQLVAPASAPADLAPVSSTATGTVLIVGASEIREVDMTSIGCARPARPEVHRNLVYVPCNGAGKIVVLDDKGLRATDDITVPGDRDAELVVDDGNLIVNVPGSQAGLIVRADGRIDDLTRYDERVQPTPISGGRTTPPPVQDIQEIADRDREPPVPPVDPPTNPSSGPSANPSSNPPSSTATPPTGGSSAPTGTNTVPALPPGIPPGTGTGAPPGVPTGPGTGGTPDTPGPGEPTTPGTPGTPGTTEPTDPGTVAPPEQVQAPGNVTATIVSEGVVDVTWTHGGVPALNFDVSITNSSVALTSVAGTARQARITIPMGQSVQFVVTAIGATNRAPSAPSAAVVSSGRPTAPGTVGGSVSRGAYDAGSVTATVTWGEADAMGSAVTGYVVTVTGGNPQTTTTQRVGADARTTTVTLSCADTGNEQCDSGATSASVHATNAQGDGPASVRQIDAGAPSAPRLPAGARQHVTGESGGNLGQEGTGDVTLSLAPAADWAGFAGTCRAESDQGSQQVECGATSISFNYSYGYQWAPCGIGSGGGNRQITRNHSVVFTADNGNNTVQSLTYSWTTTQIALCDGQQIP